MKGLKKKQNLLVALVALASLSNIVSAQDYLADQTEEILNPEQIHIDGTFKKESAADRVAQMRKQLEEQNSQMVQKKIEDIRIKQEQELAGKLKQAFQGNLKAMDQATGENVDSVDTVQAAPQRVVAPMPEFEEPKEEKLYKVIPYVGGKVYNSEDIDSFNANVDTGIAFETMLTERFSLGFRVGYTSMDFTDSDTYLSSVNNNYYEDLEVDYKNLSIGVQSKFFLSTSRFRPYVAVGAAYNRTSLELTNDIKNNNNGCYYYGGGYYCYNNLEDEDLKATGTNFTGTAALGTEILFNDSVGLNFEFSYTRAFNSAFDAKSNTSGTSKEQVQNFLEGHGESLDDSDIAALNVGFILKF